MEIKFYSYGACREVTGSKHFISVDGNIVQIDSGMFQGRREESYLKNRDLKFSPSDVTSILLTHGHFDHSGALPIMVKNGFNGNIFSTSATRDIANIILMDSAYIQAKDYEYLQKKAEKHPDRELKLYSPLYESQDVIDTMHLFATINYRRPFYPAPNIEAEFLDAGHILGSSMIRLTMGNGVRIGFSGDLGRANLPIIKDPETFSELDYLVLEGTYGNRLHDSIGMAEEELAKVINRVVKRKGKIIIPAFTIERTQELIYFIHLLQQEKKIPRIPIFVDSPMAVNATSIFKLHPECFDQETYDTFTSHNIDPFGFENIKYVTSVKESKEINEKPAPAIIISASGMAENGRILHHLRNNIEDPKNLVAVVGYMAANTLGRKLVDRYPEVKIFGKPYQVNAEVVTLDEFSAHADYGEIKTWLGKQELKNLKKIFLVHGETDSLDSLQRELLDFGIPAVEIVECGQKYHL